MLLPQEPGYAPTQAVPSGSAPEPTCVTELRPRARAAGGKAMPARAAPAWLPTDAIDLYATILSARSLNAAAHALVGTLSTSFGFTRASIGLHENGRTRLLASSHLEAGKAATEAGQRVLGAMDEAIEQSVSLSWPPATEADGVVADRIRVEQAALHRLSGAAVVTVPLGGNGNVFGAVVGEREAALPLSAGDVSRLEDLLALAAPALRWMQHGEESWTRRMERDLRRGWDRLRQPDRRMARRLLAGTVLVVMFLALAPLERTIGGRARVEGAVQRVLAAPTDGFVKAAHVRPGDRVKAGDALVDLLDGDLRLERERWGSQLTQHENAYAGAMARSDRGTAASSLSRISEAQSQMALVDEQLQRGRVTAPFDALVIQGDLSQSIGTPVRQGDTLMTLATSGQYRVIVEVDEVDIARVQVGQPGQLALSSLPWGGQDLRVERIAPLAKAVDGRNAFEVEASLPNAPAELRPGLLGRAELVVGRMPPLWAWAGHALDRLRVSWWAWLG